MFERCGWAFDDDRWVIILVPVVYWYLRSLLFGDILAAAAEI
jgi:hypothetical protein